jgi:hypothetical protein
MIKRSLVLLVVGLGTLVACDDTTYDCFSCQCNPDYCYVPPRFQDLSQRWHVLNNFELAHNKRDMSQYDRLIDDNYTFIFDTLENDSLVTIQWGRADDVTATAGLFAAANSMDMAVDWKDSPRGNPAVQWSERISGTETWYYTTIFYHFTIRIGATTYIPVVEAQMTFTVRNAGTSAKPQWRLVELDDLAHIVAPPPAATTSTAMHTEATSYGRVKSGL